MRTASSDRTLKILLQVQADIAALKSTTSAARELTAETNKQNVSAQSAQATAQRDIEILRAKLSGNKQIVTILEREKAIEEEINRLKRTGLSLEQARAAASQKVALQSQLAAKSASGFSATSLLGGFVGGVGAGLITQLPSVLSRVAGSFVEAVGEGVRFNATLETVQLGIAATIKQFDRTGKFKNFDDAMIESGKAIDLLKQKAVESPATFEQLVKSFQGISAAASSANIPLKQQVDLVVLMSQALSGMGIASEQILQESRALLTGNITEDAMAAKQLQITKAQIEKAKSEGQLFEFLTSKLAAYGEAGVRSQQTFNTALSNMTDALTLLKAEAAKPIFKQVTDELLEFNKAVGSVEARAAARVIGQDMSVLLKIVTDTVKSFAGLSSEQDRQSVSGVATQIAVGSLVQSFVGLNAATLLRAKGLEASVAAEQIRTEEFKKQVEALYEQAAAQKTAADTTRVRDAAEKFVVQTNAQLNAGYFKSVDYVTQIRDLVANDLIRNTARWKSLTEGVANAAQMTAEAFAKIHAAGMALIDIDDETQRNRLQALGDEKALLDFDMERLRVKRQFDLQEKGVPAEDAAREAQEFVDSERAKLEALKKTKDEKTAGTAASRAETAELRQQRDLMQEITSKQSAIAGNPFLTTNEKNAQLIPLLQQEAEAHLAAGNAAEAHARQMDALALTFSGGIQANLISWVNSLGTAASQVAGVMTSTLNTAINSTAAAITGLIFRTTSWKQAFAQAAQAIIQQLIQVGIQMLVQAAISSFIKKKDAGESTQAGAQIAASYAPGAAAASVATSGGSAIWGTVAAVAAIAAIIAAILSFETGGRVPGAPSTTDNRLAAIATGETIINAPASQFLDRALGPNWYGAMNNMRIPARLPAFASGGRMGSGGGSFAALSGGAGSGGDRPMNIAIFDDRNKLEKWLASQDGDKLIFDSVSRQRIDLGG